MTERLLRWLTKRTAWYQQERLECEQARIDLAIANMIIETWKYRKPR